MPINVQPWASSSEMSAADARLRWGDGEYGRRWTIKHQKYRLTLRSSCVRSFIFPRRAGQKYSLRCPLRSCIYYWQMSGSCLISHRFRWFQKKKSALFFPSALFHAFFPFPCSWFCDGVSSVAVQWCPAARSDSSTRMRFRTRYWCCKKKRWGEGSDAEGWSASAHAPPSHFTCRPSPIPLACCTARLRSA